VRSRARRHGDTEHGGDRNDQDRCAESDGHAVNGCHGSGGFFLGSAGGSSASPKLIDVSAEYF
jgi:hypothetical protein